MSIPSAMPSSVGTIAQSLRTINKSSFGNEAERIRATEEAIALAMRLETPYETAMRFSFTQSTVMACIRTCSKLKLFSKWSDDGGGPRVGNDLARLVECDSILLSKHSQPIRASFCF